MVNIELIQEVQEKIVVVDKLGLHEVSNSFRAELCHGVFKEFMSDARFIR